MATVYTVKLDELPEIEIGAIIGRWEVSLADNRVKNRWLSANANDRLSREWDDSWDNSCASSGPRALYRVEKIEDGKATLVCIKSKS